MISLVRKPATPELDRQAAVLDLAHSIGAFLEWLTGGGGGGVQLMRWVTDGTPRTWTERDQPREFLVADGRSFEQLLAAYFQIDLDAIADERMALIDYLRAVTREDEARSLATGSAR